MNRLLELRWDQSMDGAVRTGELQRSGLVDLFGSDDLVSEALRLFEGQRTDKEKGILDFFARALNEAGTKTLGGNYYVRLRS
jgi:hypothetical protein